MHNVCSNKCSLCILVFFSVACLRKELGLALKRNKRLLLRLGMARLDSRMKKKISYPLRNRL